MPINKVSYKTTGCKARRIVKDAKIMKHDANNFYTLLGFCIKFALYTVYFVIGLCFTIPGLSLLLLLRISCEYI